MTGLEQREELLKFAFSEFRKGNAIRGRKMLDIHEKMVSLHIDWIEKGVVGRFIHKYLGI